MQRKCVKLKYRYSNNQSELFHLQTSIGCLNRILNDQDPYPGIDSRSFRKNNLSALKFLAEGLVFILGCL